VSQSRRFRPVHTASFPNVRGIYSHKTICRSPFPFALGNESRGSLYSWFRREQSADESQVRTASLSHESALKRFALSTREQAPLSSRQSKQSRRMIEANTGFLDWTPAHMWCAPNCSNRINPLYQFRPTPQHTSPGPMIRRKPFERMSKPGRQSAESISVSV